MDYAKINKKWWNDITPIHTKSSLYNLKNFKKGKTSLSEIELKELTDVRNKSMLHLMCHFGMDSLSWAKKGAKVTGVDISDVAIDTAKKLSSEISKEAEFICSDIYELPKKLNKKFDIVFMSYGVLLWLSDIKKFAKTISHFLKKNGTFYIVELHPFTNILDYNLKLNFDYFDKGPFLDDADGSYTNWEDKSKGITYQWSYTISDLINALISENFSIEFLHEFPFTTYPQFKNMRKDKKGRYFVKDNSLQIPLLFSLKAKIR